MGGARLMTIKACSSLALGTAILSLAAIVYGRAFIYHDSGTYYLYGQHIASEIVQAAKFSRADMLPFGDFEKDYVGARSPSYSLVLYLSSFIDGLSGIVIVQSVSAAWVLLLLFKSAVGAHFISSYLFCLALLSVASSLSYFACFAMPDVYAGVGALAAVTWALFGDRMTRLEAASLCFIVALSASFHPTIPLLLVAAACIGVAAAALLRAGPPRLASRLGIVCVAVFAGWLTGPLYRTAEQLVFRHALYAPPFVTARLLGDGTGLAYLDETCPHTTVSVLCNIPMQRPVDSDAFLWGTAEQGGVYRVVDPGTRMALRSEQLRFVASVILAHPLEQLRASLLNAWQQLVAFEVAEPLWDPKTQASFSLFRQFDPRVANGVQFAGEDVLAVLRQVLTAVSALGCVLFVGLASRRRFDRTQMRVLALTLAMMAVVVVNAAICGALSKPWPRYEARAIWLLPACLMTIIAVSVSASKRMRAPSPEDSEGARRDWS
jgi:hypothetical protein